jgi:hypothetical protein
MSAIKVLHRRAPEKLKRFSHSSAQDFENALDTGPSPNRKTVEKGPTDHDRAPTVGERLRNIATAPTSPVK